MIERSGTTLTDTAGLKHIRDESSNSNLNPNFAKSRKLNRSKVFATFAL